MGVPGLFPWFRENFSSKIIPLEKYRKAYEEEISANDDPTQVTAHAWDCLHLDLNGFIHGSAAKEIHGAGKEPDLEKIFARVCEAIEGLVKIVRPRKLLNLCMDGVAPRAKMNQQRSRRYKSKAEKIRDRNMALKVDGKECEMSDRLPDGFDSNVISPGTKFMSLLAEYLRQHFSPDRTHPVLPDLTIVLSDSQVPGEGEHKILALVRAQPPSLRHLVVGDDADLLLLGLACRRRAPRFTILRAMSRDEDGVPKHYSVIDVAGVAQELGALLEKKTIISASFEAGSKSPNGERVKVEESDLDLDYDRMVDDFIYLCSIVGNDFLPCLPASAIFEGGLDAAVSAYTSYLATHTFGSGASEPKTPTEPKADFKHQPDEEKNEKKSVYLTNSQAYENAGGMGVYGSGVKKVIKLLAEVERVVLEKSWLKQADNTGAVAGMRKGRKGGGEKEKIRIAAAAQEAADIGDSTVACLAGQAIEPSIKAWEEVEKRAETKGARGEKIGSLKEFRTKWSWRWQYYLLKVARYELPSAIEGMGAAYAQGMAFVHAYYFHGVPAWEWHYPYHYAPFAAELANAPKSAFSPIWISEGDKEKDNLNFASSGVLISRSKPASPLTQLLAIFPPCSAHGIPRVLHNVICPKDTKDPYATSDLRDRWGEAIYPRIVHLKTLMDIMGEATRPWLWVARLPFVPLDTLKKAVESAPLSEEERERNKMFDGVHLLRPHCRYIQTEAAKETSRPTVYAIATAAGAIFLAMVLRKRKKSLTFTTIMSAATLVGALGYIWKHFIHTPPLFTSEWESTSTFLTLDYLWGETRKSKGRAGVNYTWVDFRCKPVVSMLFGSISKPAGGKKRRGRNRNRHKRGIPLHKLKKIAKERTRPQDIQVREQIDYYFGAKNFPVDDFLQSQQLSVEEAEEKRIQESKTAHDQAEDSSEPPTAANEADGTGWVPIDVIMSFKMMRLLLSEARIEGEESVRNLMHKAVQSSKVVIMSSHGNYLRRRKAIEMESVF
ncbi:hypothetical protein AAMO2058_001756400 [Amorphochlora amoebiformis]